MKKEINELGNISSENKIEEKLAKNGMIISMTEDQYSFDAYEETINACRYLITLCHKIEIERNELGYASKINMPEYLKYLCDEGEASRLRNFIEEGMRFEANKVSSIIKMMEKTESKQKPKPCKPKRNVKRKIYKPSDACLKRVVSYVKKSLESIEHKID